MNKIILLVALFSLLFSCRQQEVHLSKIEGKLLPIDSQIGKDSTITHLIAPFKEELKGKMNTVLAYCPTNLSKERNKPETAIGNFMADLCFTRGNAVFKKETGKNIDFVLLNAGGVRSGIGKGAVTTKSAYEVMPFENNMVVAELSYKNIQLLFTYLAQAKMAHPISKNLRVQIKNNSIKSVTLNNNPLVDRTYYVLTSDYLQRGGDRMNFFKNPISLTDLHYKIRTAILDELAQIDTINAIEDKRVIWIDN